MSTRFCLGLLFVGLLAVPAGAHYNMLLPEKASAKKDEVVQFTYQWGHPFEHQLFDALKPERVGVLTPGGKGTDLTESLEKVSVPGADGKKVAAYRFRFTPAERGDYVFLLETPPLWMEEEGEFWQDAVKVVLHVQAQKGWEKLVRDEDFEFEPLTRPYGLLPGMVFQAQLQAAQDAIKLAGPKEQNAGRFHERTRGRDLVLAPLAGALVEIERYNAVAPKELPPDELITRTARTDLKGVVTTTLTEPGWWSLTTSRKAGMRKHEGKERPVRQRSTLWVFVEDRPASR